VLEGQENKIYFHREQLPEEVMGIYYLALMPFGVVLANDKGEIVASALAGKSFEEARAYLQALEGGALTQDALDLIKRHLTRDDTLYVEDEDVARFVTQTLGLDVRVEPGSPVFRGLRAKMPATMAKLMGVQEQEFYNLLHQMTIELARSKLKEVAEKRDLFVAQAIRALDDVNKTINLFASRVREWYGLHFPELDELAEDHEDYLKIVSKIGYRSSITEEALREIGIKGELASKIVSAAANSMGAELAEFDLEAIRLISDMGLQLYSVRRSLEKYIDEAMYEVAPNIRALVGSLLGARLISLAGGLDKLARLPASTIQVLGAEKALFRALKYGAKPPKHGVIFQHPLIHRSPKWQRGKIARALAAKLAIAARIDAFTGEYRADELREDLEKRVEEIRTLYPTPPKKARAEGREKTFKRKGKERGGR
jgi:nucleolar protein 56